MKLEPGMKQPKAEVGDWCIAGYQRGFIFGTVYQHDDGDVKAVRISPGRIIRKVTTPFRLGSPDDLRPTAKRLLGKTFKQIDEGSLALIKHVNPKREAVAASAERFRQRMALKGKKSG